MAKKSAKRRADGIDVQLRAAIEQEIAGGEANLHTIAKGADVPYPRLYVFIEGEKDIRLSTAAKLAQFLGLELAPRRAR